MCQFIGNAFSWWLANLLESSYWLACRRMISRIHPRLKKLLVSMSSFVSIYYILPRSWKIEKVSTPILAEVCSKNALAGLTFERTKPLEVQQLKQVGKIKQVMGDSQMRRTKCSITIGTRLVCLWRLVGSLFRVSCLQSLVFFPLSWPWMPSRPLSQAHILKILIL